jgi:midasin
LQYFDDDVQAEDLKFIASNLHLGVPPSILDNMVAFLSALQAAANERPQAGRPPFAAAGGPWEFNLRDLLRWCDLLTGAFTPGEDDSCDAAVRDAAEHFVHVLFEQRLRSQEDRQRVAAIWEEVWGAPLRRAVAGSGSTADMISLDVTPKGVRIGRALLPRGDYSPPAFVPFRLQCVSRMGERSHIQNTENPSSFKRRHSCI